MKCKKCGSEWNISKGMNTAIDKCPFCGASLVSADDDLEGIMRWIVQTRGISVFLNDGTINGILSDLIQGDNRYKRQIKIALSAGAGRAFYSMVSKGTMSKLERTSRMTSLLIDEGFSESFANDIASIFEYSIAASDSPAEDNNDADSNDVNLEELMNEVNRILERDASFARQLEEGSLIADRINELENQLYEHEQKAEALDREIDNKNKTITSIEKTIRKLERMGDISIDFARNLLDRKNNSRIQGEVHPHNNSEYSINEAETRKVRFTYGLTERQFRSLFDKASQRKGGAGANLLIMLESRLDNVVFRMGLVPTRREARQLVNQGHFLVNGKKASSPSMELKAGDVVSVNPKSQSLPKFTELRGKFITTPAWIDLNINKLEGRVIRTPERTDVDLPIEEHYIEEFYSS